MHYFSVMKDIILCSSNQILVRSLYGVLRDEGHCVEIIEHPAFAVQKIIQKHYDFILIDAEPFGLSAEDAVQIMTTLQPDIRILYLGTGDRSSDGDELDLEELKRMIDSIAV